MQKYPRTHHIEGSRLQPGDEDLESVPFAELRGRYLVVEEKVDGANAAIRFDERGELLLQSRGHYLRGGPRERHFDLLKRWAAAQAQALRERLGDRYVLYGEWLYAKHTVFYDALPHYFLEFDVLDTRERTFLSTSRRRTLLAGAPVASVPVLFEGTLRSHSALTSLVGRSLLKSDQWRARLAGAAMGCDVDVDRVVRETDPSDEMEGLYVKIEEGERVAARFKYVRASFLTCVVDSGTHWLNRPIVPNELPPHVDLFASVP
jgi:hypothetical protein